PRPLNSRIHKPLPPIAIVVVRERERDVNGYPVYNHSEESADWSHGRAITGAGSRSGTEPRLHNGLGRHRRLGLSLAEHAIGEFLRQSVLGEIVAVEACQDMDAIESTTPALPGRGSS